MCVDSGIGQLQSVIFLWVIQQKFSIVATHVANLANSHFSAACVRTAQITNIDIICNVSNAKFIYPLMPCNDNGYS